MTLRKWVVGTALVLLSAGAAVYAVGTLLPRDHVAARTILIGAEPSRVGALVRDVEAQPRWRGDVEAIEVLERRAGAMRYRERSQQEAILFDFSEVERGMLFRSRIADPSLPFAGAWTIEVASATGGSRVTVEERGSVRDPLYRFFSAVIFGYTATMDAYLADHSAGQWWRAHGNENWLSDGAGLMAQVMPVSTTSPSRGRAFVPMGSEARSPDRPSAFEGAWTIIALMATALAGQGSVVAQEPTAASHRFFTRT